MRRAIPFTALILLAALVLSGFSSQEIVVGRRRAAAAGGTWNAPSNSCETSATNTTLNCTAFSNALTNPSIIVVGIQYDSAQSAPVVTDTAGNTYNDSGLGTYSFQGSTRVLQIFCATNTHTTSSNVVNMAVTGSSFPIRIVAAEFTETGATPGCTSDKQHSQSNQTGGTGGTDSLVLTNDTTTKADLIYVCVGTHNANITAGTGFTLISTPTGGHGAEYKIQSVAGSITPTASDSSTGDGWGGGWVGWKP